MATTTAAGSGSRTDLSRRGLTSQSLACRPAESGCRVLDLSHNELSDLPAGVCPADTLQQLNLSSNRLAAPPRALFALSKLVHLDLANNDLSSLADDQHPWSALPALHTLSLAGNAALADLQPICTPSLRASLKILSLAACSPSLALAPLAGFVALRSLDLSSLALDAVPDAVLSLASLQLLYLNDNRLTALPDALFQRLTSLRDLQLARNRIEHLTPPTAAFFHLKGLVGNPLIHPGPVAPLRTELDAALQRQRDTDATLQLLRDQLADADALRDQLAAARRDLDRRDIDGEALRHIVQQRDAAADALRNELAASQAETETLRTELATRRANVDTLATHQSHIERLSTELSTSQADVERLRTELSTSQFDVERLRTELSTSQFDVERLRNELSTSQFDVERLRTELATNQSDIESLRTDLTNSRRDVEALQRSDAARQQLADELAAVQQQREEGQAQELAERLRLAEQKRGKLEKELELLREELEDTNDTLKTTSTINGTLEEAIVCLREHQKQSDADRQQQTAKIVSLEEENQSLRGKNTELQLRLDSELSTRSDSSSDRVVQLEARVDELSRQLAAQADSFKEKIARKDEKISGWLSTIAEITKSLDSTQKELAGCRGELAAAQARVAELEAGGDGAAKKSHVKGVPSAKQFRASSLHRDPNSGRLPAAGQIQTELNIALDELDSTKTRLFTTEEILAQSRSAQIHMTERIKKLEEELAHIEKSAQKRTGGFGSLFGSSSASPITQEYSELLARYRAETVENQNLKDSISALTSDATRLQTENASLKQALDTLAATQHRTADLL